MIFYATVRRQQRTMKSAFLVYELENCAEPFQLTFWWFGSAKIVGNMDTVTC